MEEFLAIQNRDYWLKVVEMLKQKWTFIFYRIQKPIGQKIRFKNAGVATYILILIVVIFIISSSPSFAAVTQIQDPNVCGSYPCWEISGLITQSDVQELLHIVDSLKGSTATPWFRLNSHGGDVEAAIAIGRLLRKIHASAVTWEYGGCYSSCVFILAGAVNRYGRLGVGIHRPYSIRTDMRDYQAIQSDQRRIAKLAKDYLEEVNVLPSLYDAMVSIPPEKIKMLSESELDSYGLLQVDPVEQEIQDAAEARRYGISKIEYIRRKAQVNVICGDGRLNSVTDAPIYVKCREDVLSSRR